MRRLALRKKNDYASNQVDETKCGDEPQEKRMPFAGVHDSGEERDDSKLRESERHDARRKASNGPEYRSGLLLEC